MTYGTLTAVQAYIPPGYTIGAVANVSSSAGVPSYAQVQQFLSDTSNEIDSALASRGIAVPVTQPAWFVNDLTRLNNQGAAALVLLQMSPLIAGQVSGTAGQPQRSLGDTLQAAFKATLQNWRDKGTGIPVAVPVAEADLAPRDFFSDSGAYGQPADNVQDAYGNPISAVPAFTREKVF